MEVRSDRLSGGAAPSPLLVSRLRGRRVRDDDGAVLGRLDDLTISHGADEPELRRVFLRDRAGRRVLDAAEVDLTAAGDLRVRPGAAVTSPATDPQDPSLALAPTELRLVRDVLDAQIVDLTGHHLVRVGDVLLSPVADRARVVAVDVGFGAVLRRLGPAGRHVGAGRRARGERLVPWSELHLTSRRGHEVQLESRSPHLVERTPREMAHLLARLSVGHASDVLQQASVGTAAAAIAASHDEIGRRLLAAVPEASAEQLLGALPEARARTLRRRLSQTRLPQRRYHRSHGWRRHAPAPEPAGSHGADPEEPPEPLSGSTGG